ncbi:hypothetical protein [Bifidobacterium pseudolongum]|uniref:hypothetical protein n=1 Tax=Bifidobacterium pseudolongum TaxID=1694 RepID=UPI0013ED553C|nr:hypothetical protein [Bifidobacterium pseudolongum]
MAQRPDDEQDPLLTQTGQYTRAPKVSHEVLTKQEREELLKERAVKQQAAQRLNQPCAGGPMGRWWRKLQSGPDKVTLAMSIVALGVVYGDIGGLRHGLPVPCVHPPRVQGLAVDPRIPAPDHA